MAVTTEPAPRDTGPFERPLTPPAPLHPGYYDEQRNSALPPTPHTPFVERRPLPPTPGLRPYLSLGPRLLLSVFSPALIPLMFTVAHLVQTRASTAALAASLKNDVMSACGGLATGASILQSIPRYLAMQTNAELLRAARQTVMGIGLALMDIILVIEAVLKFVIDMYRSLLMCVIQLVVQGTLSVLIGAVEAISKAVTASLDAIRTSIQNDIASFNNIVQKAVGAVNNVVSVFGTSISIPAVNIPSLAFLQNVTIPTTFEDSLIKLNKSLPTLDEVRTLLDKVIDMPLDKLIDEINVTRHEIAAQINDSILPTPSLHSLGAGNAAQLQAELCNNVDTSLIDDTAKALHTLGTTAIALMILLIILGWCVLAFWEWRRWHCMKQSVEAVETELATHGSTDAWMVVSAVEHPVIYRYGVPVLRRVAPTPRLRANLRWFLSYLAHPTLLSLLCLSVIGLVVLQIQLGALHAIQHHAEKNANATMAKTTGDLVSKLNAMSANASASYANDANKAIAAIEYRINDELFGHWINSTAKTLNNTLVAFYSEVESVLNTTFGGTILYNPINTFVYCILGNKITNLEKGITWVSNNAHVTFPTVPVDVLQMSNSSMHELVAPVTAAAVGSGPGNGDGGALGKLINNFASAIRVQQIMYGIILAVWAALLLVGLAIVLWHSGIGDRFAARRAARSNGPSGPRPPFRRPPSWPWSRPPLYEQHASSSEMFTESKDVTASHTSTDPAPSTRAETLRQLFAPAQAFLGMSGYVRSASPAPLPPLPPPPLPKLPATPVEEKEGLEPQSFWITRAIGAIGSGRNSVSRGARLGAAMRGGDVEGEPATMTQTRALYPVTRPVGDNAAALSRPAAAPTASPHDPFADHHATSGSGSAFNDARAVPAITVEAARDSLPAATDPFADAAARPASNVSNPFAYRRYDDGESVRRAIGDTGDDYGADVPPSPGLTDRSSMGSAYAPRVESAKAGRTSFVAILTNMQDKRRREAAARRVTPFMPDAMRTPTPEVKVAGTPEPSAVPAMPGA
ncbi:Plasma membrane fusion protein PRM1 [Vanrija pseudolonga]|uniref:Plasma membrane fusion protein PRM1 n=1 Tax=Vanrija pseudolonga TaxID=143232 RepID=A0AAF1BIB8_9TREE|nr:Plasma membrane fusion protein PRM1 [Vanrija pseudolonga]